MSNHFLSKNRCWLHVACLNTLRSFSKVSDELIAFGVHLDINNDVNNNNKHAYYAGQTE
jgi:hypothetical protein